MLKRLLPWSLLLVSIVMLSGCNATANELVDYYNNDAQSIAEMEKDFVSLLKEYDVLTSESNEQEEHEKLIEEKLLPKSQEIVDYVHGVELEEEEVQELHQLLIDSVEHRHHAFEIELEAVKEYFETGSEEKYNEAALRMEKFVENKQAFDKRLEELIEEYDIEVTENEE